MKTILSIGRMEPSKRPIDFIDIAREVIKKSKEESLFYWIGEGGLLDKCKQLTSSEPNIQFLGFVSEGKKKHFLKTCDIYISTSESEGFNLTVGEALLLKRPVIAYDLPVYREIYNNFIYLVPLNSRSSFVQKILQLFESVPKEMMEKAFAYIHENYSVEAVQKRLLKIFHTLLRERK